MILIILLMIFAIAGWVSVYVLLTKLSKAREEIAKLKRERELTLYLACQDRC